METITEVAPPSAEELLSMPGMLDQLKPKDVVVIYHGGCADGFTAAWAARTVLGDRAEYYAGVYQDAPPDVKGKRVYIVDFSYKTPVMLQLVKDARQVTMLDHHKSARETFDECQRQEPHKFNGVFDETRSGALLTWDWFHPAETPPMLVSVVSDRDLWQFKMPHTEAVMAEIFSREYTWENWDAMYVQLNLVSGLAHAERMGQAILRKHHKDIAELTKENAWLRNICGHEVWVCSLPKTYTSDAGHLMCTGGDPESFAACYWDTASGRVFSLRSRDEGKDVSEIAKRFGGGGHAHAAGFRIPFDADGNFDWLKVA